MKIASILVPLKGLAGEDEVLHLAFQLATGGERRAKQHAKIHVIHVVKVPQALALDSDLPDLMAHGEAVLAAAEKAAALRDVVIHADLLQARSAGIAIVDESLERAVDLILLGAQYRRRHGEFDLGSTLPYVFKNAPCRVWVARAPLPPPAVMGPGESHS